MDLLRLLETTARQIALQKDKTEGIKQLEESLRQELAAAHAQLAAKRAGLHEEQQQSFSVASEIQHQEASIAECQAINDASKAAISSVQHDRTQLSEQLQRMQDEFIQASALFNAEVRSLQAELLAFFSSGTDVLGCLQQCSSDARRVQAAQAAQAVGAGAAARVGDAAGQDAALDAWE